MGAGDARSDQNTSLCDNMDYTSDMAEDKKRWLCVPRREKKYKIQNNKKINVYVVMLLFLFEIKSMDLIKWGFIFNFLVIAPKIYSYLLLNKDFSQCFITENIGMINSEHFTKIYKALKTI